MLSYTLLKPLEAIVVSFNKLFGVVPDWQIITLLPSHAIKRLRGITLEDFLPKHSFFPINRLI